MIKNCVFDIKHAGYVKDQKYLLWINIVLQNYLITVWTNMMGGMEKLRLYKP